MYFGARAVAEFGENPCSDPRGQNSLSTDPGEVPSCWPKLFPAHGKEDHATLRPPPVFPARVTSSVPSQAPLEWHAAFFARLAEEVLAFTFVALKNPVLKDCALLPGMCGTSSFEFALSQVIAQTGPPLPTPGQPDHNMPTTPKAAHPRPLEVETAVTLQQPKWAKVLHPAPPPIPAAQKKRAPASAVAAPPPSKSLSKTAAASVPLAPSAPAPTPPLSTRARCRCKGRHTDHGMLRCGVKLVPPAGSSIRAVDVMPDMLRDINKHLLEDVTSGIILEYPMDIKTGIFIAASHVPTSSEVACALKHICRLITILGLILIKSKAVMSMSFLKVIDVPHIPAKP